MTLILCRWQIATPPGWSGSSSGWSPSRSSWASLRTLSSQASGFSRPCWCPPLYCCTRSWTSRRNRKLKSRDHSSIGGSPRREPASSIDLALTEAGRGGGRPCIHSTHMQPLYYSHHNNLLSKQQRKCNNIFRPDKSFFLRCDAL